MNVIDHQALVVDGRNRALRVVTALTEPGERQIAIRAHAVAINPVDRYMSPVGRFITPWLKYPAVLASNVGGEFGSIGAGVTRFKECKGRAGRSQCRSDDQVHLGQQPKGNEVGPTIFVDFPPRALAEGRYTVAPPARVTGRGLDAIGGTFTAQAQGVSARKMVVTL